MRIADTHTTRENTHAWSRDQCNVPHFCGSAKSNEAKSVQIHTHTHIHEQKYGQINWIECLWLCCRQWKRSTIKHTQCIYITHIWARYTFIQHNGNINRCKKAILGFVCLFDTCLFSFRLVWMSVCVIFYFLRRRFFSWWCPFNNKFFFFSRTLNFKVCLTICFFLLDLSVYMRGCIYVFYLACQERDLCFRW